ncbi:MAG: hypothetical protein LBQ52_01155 [Helicobacteraceae bacterium]|nr:hypothetical protein [Helicobacteraceae bacterium]
MNALEAPSFLLQRERERERENGATLNVAEGFALVVFCKSERLSEAKLSGAFGFVALCGNERWILPPIVVCRKANIIKTFVCWKLTNIVALFDIK